MTYDLTRFLEAQEQDYPLALAEIKSGQKTGHWMWYIFPQLKGLGHSTLANYYGINNLEEAVQYLAHPVLGQRLKEISAALLNLEENDPAVIFNSPDDLKLRSCMTLFSLAEGTEDNLFEQVLKKYYQNKRDPETIRLLEE